MKSRQHIFEMAAVVLMTTFILVLIASELWGKS